MKSRKDNGKKKQIVLMVVDDNRQMAEVVGRMANAIGCKVLIFTDAAAALERVLSMERLDVLVTDIVMPGALDGHELARQVEGSRPCTKVVKMTGYDYRGNAAAQAGDDNVIQKPLRLTDMEKIVAAISGTTR